MRRELEAVAGYFDRHNGSSEHEHTLQILKIGEEFGEVVQAWIGYRGQNPRKGVTHTIDDVNDELCDVIVTALVAIQRLGTDAETRLNERLSFVMDRVGIVVDYGKS